MYSEFAHSRSFLQVLGQQREEELRRQRHLDQQDQLVFTEDASRLWKRQERVWAEERAARQRLMDDVIEDWHRQARQKRDGKNDPRSN